MVDESIPAFFLHSSDNGLVAGLLCWVEYYRLWRAEPVPILGNINARSVLSELSRNNP